MKVRALHLLGVVLLALACLPFIAHTFPAIIGADQSYVVLSGSMEPSISTGAVVYVEDVPARSIGEGDVITFYTSSAGPPTTHRVHEKIGSGDDTRFVTKGDANEDPDAEVVKPENIVGVIMFSIPFIGYVIQFAGTDLGILLFILVPSALLIVNEAWELYREAVNDAESDTT